MNDDDRESTHEVEPKPIASDRQQDGSGSISQGKSPVGGNEDSSPRARTNSMSLLPGVTGSQIGQGKDGRKYNAIKHGILSNVTVLKNGSFHEYSSLLVGLVEYFEPQGAMEHVLVEKLGTLLWRYRRFVAAELAEIQTSTEFLEWDEENKQQKSAVEIERNRFSLAHEGLIRGRTFQAMGLKPAHGLQVG